MNDTVYLWINVCDLDCIGIMPGLGSPLKMMIRGDLGDTMLDGAWYGSKAIDENFVLVQCSRERAEAITGGLDVIAKRRVKRPVRTKITTNLPGKSWKWASP